MSYIFFIKLKLAEIGIYFIFLFFFIIMIFIINKLSFLNYIIKEYIFLTIFFFIILLLLIHLIKIFNNNKALFHLITIYILTLIIVFQPEIRALILNISSFLFKKNIVKVQFNKEKELIDSLKFLSEHSIGALIAIDVNIDVSKHITRGVILNAKLSKEILCTIFWPGTPLHDGGVIIQGENIIQAACIFPLTNKELPSFLGTRHRAGIGLSEKTEAIVLIVSEERGEISLCYKGVLYQNLSLKKIEQRLKQILYKDKKKIIFEKKSNIKN